MGSIRLPGKVLKKVLDKPLLEYQIERVKRAKHIDKIVIATTTNDLDQPIIELCEKLSTSYFCGDENDVLARYYEAAKIYKADIIVRLTSDCPIIDPNVIDKLIEYFTKNQSKYDYVSNTLNRSYPRGMDVEVLSFKCLTESYLEAKIQSEREHVTPFIYKNLDRYRVGNINYSENQSLHRWTVDTMEDFNLIKKIIEELYPENNFFTLEDTLTLLKKHPDWSLINNHIKQKKIK